MKSKKLQLFTAFLKNDWKKEKIEVLFSATFSRHSFSEFFAETTIAALAEDKSPQFWLVNPHCLN